MLYAIAFTSGMFIGTWLTSRRWRSNADEQWRIEWGGKLYKVHHADTFPEE